MLLALGAGVLLVALLSLVLGRYPMSVSDVLGMLASRIAPIQGAWSSQQEMLFFNVRLPRVLLALMVGCSLSAAGASFQGVFQNPLVSPDCLGASQGAALGACVAILFSWGSLATSVVAFAVSMASVVVALAVSGRARGNRILATVLAGVMVSSLFQAGVSYTKLVADQNAQLQAITFWLMGSLVSARIQDLALIAVPVAVGNMGLLALRWHINALTMGDEEALSLGVDAPRVRAACRFRFVLASNGHLDPVSSIGSEFEYAIYDADDEDGMPGKVLAGPFRGKVASEGDWTEVVLERPQQVGSSFYVALTQLGSKPGRAVIGVDDDTPGLGSSFDMLNGAWNDANVRGSYMIRADLSSFASAGASVVPAPHPGGELPVDPKPGPAADAKTDPGSAGAAGQGVQAGGGCGTQALPKTGDLSPVVGVLGVGALGAAALALSFALRKRGE